MIELRLYLAGCSTKTEYLVGHLRALFSKPHLTPYRLEVIDVLSQPEMAEADQILATPTLVKLAPAPSRRLVGNLSDFQRVLRGLELNGDKAATEQA